MDYVSWVKKYLEKKEFRQNLILYISGHASIANMLTGKLGTNKAKYI